MDYPKADPRVGLHNGKFTDGSSDGTVKPSLDPASWSNAVTDEILNVIVAGGLVPDELDHGQMAVAVANMIANALAGFEVPDSGIGKHTIAVPASFMDPTITSGCGYYSRVEVAAGQPEVAFLPFDAVVSESAEFRVPVPKSWNGGAVTAMAIWSHGAASQYGVAWGIKAAFLGNDDAHGTAWGAEVVVTDMGGTVNDVYVTAESPAITPSGTPANDGLLIVRVSRKVADAADTLNVDARLMAMKLLFTTDAATDA